MMYTRSKFRIPRLTFIEIMIVVAIVLTLVAVAIGPIPKTTVSRHPMQVSRPEPGLVCVSMTAHNAVAISCLHEKPSAIERSDSY